MSMRWNYGKVAPGAYEAMDALDRYSHSGAIERPLLIAAINAWNRLSIASRLRPGTYQPAPA